MQLSRKEWLALVGSSLAVSIGVAYRFWEPKIHQRFNAPVESMLGKFHFTNKTTAPDPDQEGKVLPAFEDWEGKLTPKMLERLRSLMLDSTKYQPKPLPPPFNTMTFYPEQPPFRAHFEVFIGEGLMIKIEFLAGGYICSLERDDDYDRRIVNADKMNELYDDCMKQAKKLTYVYRHGDWELR
jgi:hypothetical protein